jgi:hypothetical protein
MTITTSIITTESTVMTTTEVEVSTDVEVSTVSTTSTTTTTTPTPDSPTPTLMKAGIWVEEDRSQSDPLPPVNEYDDRPVVRDLITKHSVMITDIRTSLQDDPLYDPIKHDDLWIMRYVLSHKTNVVRATTAAKKFLVYRKERRLDDVDIRDSPPGLDCQNEGVRQFYNCLSDKGMVFSNPDPNRGVVLSILLAGWDQTKIAALSEHHWPFWYFLEWMFQILDSTTRKTGRLTKGIRFMDMKGFSLRQNNQECLNRNTKNASDCQDHYPQMLASVYVLNTPTWARVAFSVLKPMLPTRFVEKFAVINPLKNKKDSLELLKHLAEEHLPVKEKDKTKTTTTPTKTVAAAAASGSGVVQ